MRIELPPYVLQITGELRKGGYEAWAVGGCVRDSLLGRIPCDWDITTSAVPDEVLACLGRAGIRVICGSGLKHGTVTAIADGAHSCEITTYRSESAYSDSRRPDSVRFVPELETDLSRRDFTVNAMATDGEQIVDPFGGRSDLRTHTLRAVGDPEIRFCEDALRILRALRFSSQLGFEIGSATLLAMKRLAPHVTAVSAERRLAELDKLLSGEYAAATVRKYGDILNSSLGISGDCEAFSAAADVGVLTRDRDILFALFFGENANPAAAILKLSNARRAAVSSMLEMKTLGIPSCRADMLRAMRRYKKNTERCLEYCALDPKMTQSAHAALELVSKLRREKACYEISSLAVRGEDLISLGFEGKQIGRALDTVLDAVIRGELPDERKSIMEFLENMRGAGDVFI